MARDHPLVGRIWDASANRLLARAALVARLASREFILLGEKHDNADHHRLQAAIIDDLVAAGRHPAVAFEMLPADTGATLERAITRHPAEPGALRAAVRWDESGWPAWRIYEPVFAAALHANLPVVAAGLPRADATAIGRRGLGALEADLRARLGLDIALAPTIRRAMKMRIRAAHCGQAPEHILDRMVDVQRARDAQLARAALDAARSAAADGTVLITGTEHARRDAAVPTHLARWEPAATVVSLAFVEVVAGRSDASGYLTAPGGGQPAFDYLWFTPRVDDRDPCKRSARQLRRLRSR